MTEVITKRVRTRVRYRWDAILTTLAVGVVGFTLGMVAQAAIVGIR
jgi:hypothetical protein